MEGSNPQKPPHVPILQKESFYQLVSNLTNVLFIHKVHKFEYSFKTRLSM